MARKLINPSEPFELVFSLFSHQYLGILLSSHVVKKSVGTRLSLEYQGLSPKNFDQFSHGFLESDKELVQLISEINPKEIQARFIGKKTTPHKFYNENFNGAIKNLIREYINRRMGILFSKLVGRRVFEMGNDGYPAYKENLVVAEKGTVLFHFMKNEDNTHYFPTIKFRGKKIEWQYKKALIVSEKPGWLAVDGEVFSFEPEMDGLKLKPFLHKKFIRIPSQSEETYYDKFVRNIIENYRVYAKGFHIYPINEDPEFMVEVKQLGKDGISIEQKVRYGEHVFDLRNSKPVGVGMRKLNGTYHFSKVFRNIEQEKEKNKIIESLTNGKGLLESLFMKREKGLEWIRKSKPTLDKAGIRVVQRDTDQKVSFSEPRLSIKKTENGDWFDIEAIVEIDDFRIPFSNFKRYILGKKREYLLPDGSIFILPDSWFANYRHLIEVAEDGDEGGLRIKKFQEAILEGNSGGSGELFEKIQALAEGRNKEPVEVPDNFKASLRDYQLIGYSWLNLLSQNGLGGILADDMGLGKTIQTLAFLLKEHSAEGQSATLIVMPKSLLHNWYYEAQRFCPDLKVLIHFGGRRKKEPSIFHNYDLVLTTYGTARKDEEVLVQYPFHYIILDESQMIKNPTSKIAKAVRNLNSNFRLTLTGTPIENSLTDLWSQMAFLNPGLLGGFKFFNDHYVLPIEKLGDEGRKEQLRRIIGPFLLRRTKEEVAKELPPKIEKTLFSEMTENQKKLYEEVKSTYRNYLLGLDASGAFSRSKLNVIAGLQKLRQLAIHPQMVEEGKDLAESGKFQDFKEMLQSVLDQGSKVLVFSQFVKFLDIIKADLEQEGINHLYLTGKTTNRDKLVREFQSNKNVKAFLISIKAGGVGLNLTAADYVFILDPWWNPAIENQAVDRSHRIGQTKTVFSYKFITKDSIEEKILKLQQRKAKLSKEIISINEDSLGKLNYEEYLELVT